MNNVQKESGILIETWKFFASIRLTIALLVSIAVFSIIGTLIPQNADPQMYLHSFGEMGVRFFSFLNIYDSSYLDNHGPNKPVIIITHTKIP